MLALDVLAEDGQPRDLPMILTLSADRYALVRASAAFAMSKSSRTQAQVRLCELLGDTSEVVRIWAAAGVARALERARAIVALRAALDVEKSTYVRAGILSGLLDCGEHDAVGQLQELSGHQDKLVRGVANASLARHGF